MIQYKWLRTVFGVMSLAACVGLSGCGRWKKKGDDPAPNEEVPPGDDGSDPEDPDKTPPTDEPKKDAEPHKAIFMAQYPIVGLTYESAGAAAAKTDASGKLLCNLGDEVHFSLAGLYMGTAACNGYIFLSDLSKVKDVAGFESRNAGRIIATFGLPVKDSSDKQTAIDLTLADTVLTKLKHEKWVKDIYTFPNLGNDLPVVLAAAQDHADAKSSAAFQALVYPTNNDFNTAATEARNEKLAEITAALPAALRSRLATLSSYAGVVQLDVTPKAGCVGCAAGYDLAVQFVKTDLADSKVIYSGTTQQWKLSTDANFGSFSAKTAAYVTADTLTIFGTLSAGKVMWVTFKDIGTDDISATAKVVVRNNQDVVESTQSYDVVVNVDNRPALHIFKTAATYNGNLGGIAGADTKCNADAAKPTQATGAFKAFLMDHAGTRDANTDWVITKNKGYISMQGGEVVPIFVTRFGNDISIPLNNALTTVATEFWTGMDGSTIPDSDDCSGWTDATSGSEGAFGDANSVIGGFYWDGKDTCDTARALVCVEQP